MATCKDCIHYSRCVEIYEAAGFFFDYEKSCCKQFSDRSEWMHLPYKVGDTVFEDGLSSVIKFKVIGFKFGRMYDQDIEDYEDEAFPDEWHVEIDSGSGWKQSVAFSQIGKTVFFTKEEAEKALKERDGS